MVLRTLLRNSQAAIKLGLDLRGGIAFTMEARDLSVTADGSDPSGATAMDKVVEIMNERLNAFGVAETVVQKRVIGQSRSRFRTERPNKIPE